MAIQVDAEARPFEAALAWVRTRRGMVILTVGAIVLLGLVLRLLYPFGIIWVDSFTYSDAAISMARWEPAFDRHLVGDLYYQQYTRLSIIIPAAVLYKFFGEGDTASTVFPIVLSLSTVPVVFWFTRRYYNLTAAIAAAALITTFPWSVINSAQFMPDEAQAAFLIFGVVAFLVLAYEEGLSRRQALALWFVVGVMGTLAFYSRSTAIAVLPGAGFVCLVRWRTLLRVEILAVFGGIAATLLVFEALLIALGSSPFDDFLVLWELGSKSRVRVSWGFAEYLLLDGKFWPWMWAGMAGGLWWLARTPWRTWLSSPILALAVIIAGEYVYFEFFMDLPGLATWRKEPRYLLPMAFPMLVFAGIAISAVVDTMRKRSIPAAATVALFLGGFSLFMSVRGLYLEWDIYMTNQKRVDAEQVHIARFLANDPAAIVYSNDDDFTRPLSTRMGSAGTAYERGVTDSGRLKNRFLPDGHERVTPGSYVVVIPVEQWWPLPAAPAPHWKLVFGSPSTAAVYHAGTPEAEAIKVHQPLAKPVALGGTNLVSIGFSQDWLEPEQHAALEFVFDAPLAAPLTLPVAVRCAGETGATQSLAIPAGAAVFRADAMLRPPEGARPGRCDLVAGEGLNVAVGALTVPTFVLTQAESLAGTPGAEGWAAYWQPFFSKGGALLGRLASLPVTIPIEPIEAGDYWADIRLYNYATGEGRITVSLNGREATATWGTPDGKEGPMNLSIPLKDAPAGDKLVITFERGQQPAVLFDAVALTSEPPPLP